MVTNVDEEVPASAMEEILAAEAVQEAYVVALPALEVRRSPLWPTSAALEPSAHRSVPVRPFIDRQAATVRWWGPPVTDRRAGTFWWWGPPTDPQLIWVPPDRARLARAQPWTRS